MPVEFLTSEQEAQYGHYAGFPSAKQLAQYFHLDDGDLMHIKVLHEDDTRLGFAVQLGTTRFLGTFLSDLTEVPDNVVEHMARQLNVDASLWQEYSERSQRRHKKKIRELYGFEDFHRSQKPFFLLRHLYARAWLTAEKHLVLFDFATAWLVQHKVLLPGATIVERLVARVVDRANKRLWAGLIKPLDEQQAQRLKGLLEIEENTRFSKLELLRRQETRASSLTIKSAMQRLDKVRTLGVSDVDLTLFPVGRINVLSRYGLTAWAAAIDDLGDDHELATLLVTACVLEAVIQDEILDLLIMIVAEKFKDAEKAGLKQRLQMMAAMDTATWQLYEACQFILDDNLLGDEIRQTIFNHIPREQLEKAVALVGHETTRYAPHYYDQLVHGYRSVRLFLARLLATISFDSIADTDETLTAWQFLYRLDHEKPQPDLQQAPQEIVSSAAWRQVVFNQDELIDRRYYTFCVLQNLVAALQRRDIFITPSRRWQDQRQQLLHGEAWKKVRPQVCAALGKSTDGRKEMTELGKQLDQLYQRVAKRLAKNKAVSIKKEEGHERISLRRQKKVPVGRRLKQLQAQVYDLLPQLDLPDLLLEVQALTGFVDEFTHISEKQARADDLTLSICAVLLAEACNVGIDDVVHADVPALRRNRLLWVQQNYIRDETLTRANARLVAAHTEIPLTKFWGGGDVASADGQRFRVPIQTLYAAPSWKYFGEGRGVTYFTFTSRPSIK